MPVQSHFALWIVNVLNFSLKSILITLIHKTLASGWLHLQTNYRGFAGNQYIWDPQLAKPAYALDYSDAERLKVIIFNERLVKLDWER